ncbi:hypothetical protein SK128_012519 [Halocaridina rubra]|uniref:Class II aldolase/adducin N-terminal domain-containing protein n=1 Tax=Halocaridina rubra TaxID=373956 RepID=A0AAN8X5W6_HALRR
MAPLANGQGQGMLVAPYGLHWSEVTASNLVSAQKLDDQDFSLLEGDSMPDIAASCIHLGIRKVKPDAKVILHTHQPYATALGCMKNPTLKMIHQNSLRYYNRVAYDCNYSGLAFAIDEGKRLGEALGDKNILIMGHHGVVSVAPTISMAFDLLYYLERAAELQILTESMKEEVELIPEANCKTISESFWRDMQKYADEHFYARYRMLRKKQPDFEL